MTSEPVKNIESQIPEPRIALPTRPNYFLIHESELNDLAKGASIPYYLNFSIFLLSLSGSLIGSMLSTILVSERNLSWILYALFYFGFGCFASGLVLLFIWWRKSKKISNLADQIKKRLPPNGN